MADIKALIKEICDIKIIPAIETNSFKNGRMQYECIPEKLEQISSEKFNMLPEKYKEYVLIHLIFYKSVSKCNHYMRKSLVTHIFPDNFLYNIFKEYPNILKNIIVHAIKTNDDMIDYILNKKRDIYIDKQTYLNFENFAKEKNFIDIIRILNKYHIEDELFNVDEINIMDDDPEEETTNTTVLHQQNKYMKSEIQSLRKLVNDKDVEIKAERDKYNAFEEKIKSLIGK